MKDVMHSTTLNTLEKPELGPACRCGSLEGTELSMLTDGVYEVDDAGCQYP